MHVGAATIFQNPGKFSSDYEVYRQELQLADLAEPLGFQSIWGVEHHFTDYTMCPDVLQFLTYMAGRTTDMHWAAWSASSPGTTPCASPNRSPCWTTSATVASSWASAAVWPRSSTTASAST